MLIIDYTNYSIYSKNLKEKVKIKIVEIVDEIEIEFYKLLEQIVYNNVK